MTAALGLCLAALATSDGAVAQAKKKDNAAEKAEAAAAQAASMQRAYAAGTKAFEGGDMIGAEQHLSAALAGGGLPNAQMARALYLRGAVYRRTGRPAQAISDLTTAVWLKGGLTEVDKKKATEERQLAYREAGLGDTPPPVGTPPLDQSQKAAAAPSASGAQVVQVTQQSIWSGISMPSISMPSISMPSLTGSSQPEQAVAGAAPQTAEQTSFWSFLPSLGGGGSQPAEAAAFSTTTIPADAGSPALGYSAGSDATLISESSAWDTQTAQAAAAEPAQPQQTVASYVPPPSGPNDAYSPAAAAAAAQSAPVEQPAAPQGTSWSNPLAGTGQAVTGFFSNMFGGSQSAAPAETAVVTGSTAEGAPAWGPETTVVSSQTSSMVQRGPESPPSAAPQPEAMPWSTSAAPSAPAAAPVQVASTGRGGNFKLQVAAVRSREEADRLAQTLQSYPAVRDGLVSTEVDETVIGSMGTFYRVRLGPYASAKEPGELCKSLRPQGYDCLVVTQ